MKGGGKLRETRCCCGQLNIKLSGDPKQVLACSCDYCQRRTGAVMQQSAWFTIDQLVSKSGTTKQYQSQDNPACIYNFCPRCGSTVYWEIPALAEVYDREIYGFAVGNFADPDFPMPQIECWSTKRHRWLDSVGTEGVYAEFFKEWPEIG